MEMAVLNEEFKSKFSGHWCEIDCQFRTRVVRLTPVAHDGTNTSTVLIAETNTAKGVTIQQVANVPLAHL